MTDDPPAVRCLQALERDLSAAPRLSAPRRRRSGRDLRPRRSRASPISSSSTIPSCRRGGPSSWPRATSGSSTPTRARASRKTCATRRPMPCCTGRRRPAALARRGAGRVLRERPGAARRRARAARADRRRPRRRLVARPGAAGIALGHPPDDPARLSRIVGLGPSVPERAACGQKARLLACLADVTRTRGHAQPLGQGRNQPSACSPTSRNLQSRPLSAEPASRRAVRPPAGRGGRDPRRRHSPRPRFLAAIANVDRVVGSQAHATTGRGSPQPSWFGDSAFQPNRKLVDLGGHDEVVLGQAADGVGPAAKS